MFLFQVYDSELSPRSENLTSISGEVWVRITMHFNNNSSFWKFWTISVLMQGWKTFLLFKSNSSSSLYKCSLFIKKIFIGSFWIIRTMRNLMEISNDIVQSKYRTFDLTLEDEIKSAVTGHKRVSNSRRNKFTSMFCSFRTFEKWSMDHNKRFV